MTVAKEDSGYGDGRKAVDNGVKQGSRIGKSVSSTVTAQDMSNNPNLSLNFSLTIVTLWFIFSDASSSAIRNVKIPEVSGLVKLK